MKNFPKITGFLIPDVAIIFISCTCVWLLIGSFILEHPIGYPNAEQAKPVLYFTSSISVIYGILYWISRNAQDRDK
jgi:hypothetical protein